VPGKLAPPAGRLRAVPLSGRPVLGFDLDLTLLDLRTATARALSTVNARLGERVDVDAVVADLGPPFRAQLRQWIPDERRLQAAMALFRRAFLDEGLAHVTALPGASQAISAVHRLGGYPVVITGRRADTAGACMSRCGIAVTALVGGVTGLGKVDAMRGHRIDAYVGDHPLDMQAACHAPVPGIGVTTGSHSERALRDAGATAVVASLDEVVGWLEAAACEREPRAAHAATVRTPLPPARRPSPPGGPAPGSRR
jgi:phosphoglycolate phosphatase